MQIYINVFRNMMFIAKELLKSNNKKNPKMYGNFLWEEISLLECWCQSALLTHLCPVLHLFTS